MEITNINDKALRVCFSCMNPLSEPNQRCTRCGHDNRIRTNGPGYLPECILRGQYIVGKALGRGGFGITYIGYDLLLERKVAIKEYYPADISRRNPETNEIGPFDEQSRQPFYDGIQRAKREASIAARMEGTPNIVRTYNVIETNGSVYIIMEYVDGMTLAQYVRANNGKLPWMRVWPMVKPILSALHTVHLQGIVHKDVSPDNLMVRRSDDSMVLLDFGAAQVATTGKTEHSVNIRPGFAPLEAYSTVGQQDARTDEYAMMATIYYALTGRQPENPLNIITGVEKLTPPSRLGADIPDEAEKVLMRGMSIRIEERYSSMQEAINAFEKAQQTGVTRPASIEELNIIQQVQTGEKSETKKSFSVEASETQEKAASSSAPVSNIEQTKSQNTEAKVEPKKGAESGTSEEKNEKKAEKRETAGSYLKTRLKRFAISVAVISILSFFGFERFPSRRVSVPYSSGSTTTVRATRVPTTEATATPKAAAENTSPERVFKLNNTGKTDKGQATVSWEDSGNNSPYKVSYRYAGNGTLNNSWFWAGGNEQSSTTVKKSFVIEYLIPGERYELKVQDCNGKTISRNYTLPKAATFADGGIKASDISVEIYPRQKMYGAEDSTATEIDALIANDITTNMMETQAKEFGFRYSIRFPELTYTRSYFVQVAITDPDGHVVLDLCGFSDYKAGWNSCYYDMIGEWAFKNTYEEKTSIPAGTWKVDLYWDGMHVNQSTFEVKKAASVKPTATPRSTATSKPTATPRTTPRPTATPQRVFRLNETVKTDKGRVTISWEDSENNSPYSVSYEYVGKGNAVQSQYREDKTYSKSCTIGDLIPGKTYRIGVTDCKGKTVYHTYSLPTPSTFEDGLLKASSIKVKIELKQKNDSASDTTASNISELRAADIIANRGKKEYGFRYSMDYPKLARSRSYHTQIAITAPNDFLECELNEDVEYGAEYSGRYYYLLGDWTFWKIYYLSSSIPKGTWKVDLYWDGMHVNQSTFEVK